MFKWAMWTHLNIYVPRVFQWYKECHKPLHFGPWNRSLKFRESISTPSPKVGVALGVLPHTPSHFLTLPGVCDMTLELLLGLHPCEGCNLFALTPRLAFGPQPYNPFALVASPKLGLQQWPYNVHFFNKFFLNHHLLTWSKDCSFNVRTYI